MGNTIQKLCETGQSIWCDNLGRGMLNAGELQRLMDLGIVGVTSNPTILMKSVTGGTDYDQLFDSLLSDESDVKSLYEGLVLPDIVDAADILRPVYDKTGGLDGLVSLEVSPKLAYDTDATVEEARRLFAALNRPNVFIKVPATHEGVPAIETLISEGINVNVTLIFSMKMHEKVMQAYIAGLERRARSGGDLSKVASVASFFVSRVDTKIDALLEQRRNAHGNIDGLLGQAAIVNARLAYARFEEVFDTNGPFGALASKGARVQRPLWASTSTKNPAYSPTLYIDQLVGPQTVNTLPPASIEAVLEGGSTTVTLRDDLDAGREVLEKLETLGIELDTVTDELLTEGVDAFAQSFEELLSNLAEKQRKVGTTG